jgi:hypothetical protein
MKPIVRNILAVVAGIVLCLILNSVLLGLLMQVIVPPEGFDPNDPGTYHLLQGPHYISPFLAHALPSLVGGFLAALIAASRKMTLALVVGGLHMLGGIAAAFFIPAPTWFIVADLSLAYLPMAWIGGKLAVRRGQ